MPTLGLIDVHDVAHYLADVSLLLPGVGLAAVAGLILGRRVGPLIGRGRLLGGLLVFALGMIVAATLTPSAEAIRSGTVGSGVCDLSRFGPAPFRDIVALEDPGFNILLFLPLGFVIGTAIPRGRRFGLLAAALLVSPAIELVQLVVTPLDRACQSSDVFDNGTGLVAGFVLGAVAAWVASRIAPAEGD